jgi:hypothetical protein
VEVLARISSINPLYSFVLTREQTNRWKVLKSEAQGKLAKRRYWDTGEKS